MAKTGLWAALHMGCPKNALNSQEYLEFKYPGYRRVHVGTVIARFCPAGLQWVVKLPFRFPPAAAAHVMDGEQLWLSFGTHGTGPGALRLWHPTGYECRVEKGEVVASYDDRYYTVNRFDMTEEMKEAMAKMRTKKTAPKKVAKPVEARTIVREFIVGSTNGDGFEEVGAVSEAEAAQIYANQHCLEDGDEVEVADTSAFTTYRVKQDIKVVRK